jgi:hypothetical protein
METQCINRQQACDFVRYKGPAGLLALYFSKIKFPLRQSLSDLKCCADFVVRNAARLDANYKVRATARPRSLCLKTFGHRRRLGLIRNGKIAAAACNAGALRVIIALLRGVSLNPFRRKQLLTACVYLV